MNACAQLVVMIERLSVESPEPKRFLLRLGTEAAGIRTGPMGLLDLARGGRNRLPGSGVRATFDDDTDGQIRHFVGIATASARIGPALTRWLSVVVGRDAPASADGKLTDLAVIFAREVLDGSLPVRDAAAWVRQRVCE